LLPDRSQHRAVEALQALAGQLVDRNALAERMPARFLARLGLAKSLKLKVLYLWGGVGRGKTRLMDIFFNSLPLERKLRLHFHRFMQMVHARLREAGGKPDPLVLVAAAIAPQVEVLCFDEFYVADIGDAMILANLLQALFNEGVVLVATSNIEPGQLYQGGLQRKRFLPAIDLIRQNNVVLNVDGGADYRRKFPQHPGLYCLPIGSESAAEMAKVFDGIVLSQNVVAGKSLDLHGGRLECRRAAENVAWFDFAPLCTSPRGAADYIELASRYHTVLVSGVSVFGGDNDNEARRFVMLVDECYDRKVKLGLEAAVPIGQLYQGLGLDVVLERTRSRLTEMQSAGYLASPHIPD
jgi:cell division protein ZapE